MVMRKSKTATGTKSRSERPLVVLSDPDKYTLTIGLAYLQGTFFQNQRLVAAGTIIAVAPLIVLFISLQKHFFRGVGEGAIKG